MTLSTTTAWWPKFGSCSQVFMKDADQDFRSISTINYTKMYTVPVGLNFRMPLTRRGRRLPRCVCPRNSTSRRRIKLSRRAGAAIVRRVKPTPGSQLALFARYSYHAFITDRDGETLELEADHRRHAEIENAIRDLKYGVGLNHLPSGRFAANGAWLAVQVMAHNLARWTARIGLGERTVITKTLRRRVFALVGRLTRSARRLTLHLPRRWPWEEQFSRALARLRAIPLPA